MKGNEDTEIPKWGSINMDDANENWALCKWISIFLDFNNCKERMNEWTTSLWIWGSSIDIFNPLSWLTNKLKNTTFSEDID